MILTHKLLEELQKRLKIGNRRGVHLNAIPANSRYKFDLNRLSNIDRDLPNQFIKSLLSEQPLKFRISWKENVPDLNTLFEEEQVQLVKITKSFENLINQTETIESEKGINTFGFGYPVLVRRDASDNKLTVSPILIWSLRIKRTKEFNTWEITRTEDDPIYLNEVLINHIYSDSNIQINQLSNEVLDDGLISKDELLDICIDLIKKINPTVQDDIREVFSEKIDNIKSIGDKNYYEKLPINSTNSFIDFGGLFSIFEVQKQNIINDYGNLLELEGLELNNDELKDHYFQSISSVETDPSQQGVLNALSNNRNLIIQGPPGTGKSQTLNAVLVNALENNKKTIVVCEKRTALDVLHNSLIEKGLQFHCVLIKDIIKDRKTVVDSVRDRVDNSSYRRYSYTYSKDALEENINSATHLIDEINSSKSLINEKILGDKSWSDLVGWFLKEKRNSDEYFLDLEIEKDFFEFTTNELNYFLELFEKGNAYYIEFKKNEEYTFINKDKLIDDNPYLLEQKLKDDFKYYLNVLSNLNKSYLNFKEEYQNNHFKLINKRISSLNDIKNDLLSVKLSFFEDIQKIKSKYSESRKVEIANQLKRILNHYNEIKRVLEKHKKGSDLYDSDLLESSLYKFKAIFSKQKKENLNDIKNIDNILMKIKILISGSKDFSNINFSSRILTDKLAELERLNRIYVDLDSYIENEISRVSLFKIDNFGNMLKNLNGFLNSNDITEVKNCVSDAINLINNTKLKINNSYESYLDGIESNSPEFLSVRISNIESCEVIIDKINEVLNDLGEDIQSIINENLENITLDLEDVGYENSIYPQLKEEIISFLQRIISDSWTKLDYDSLNLDVIVSNINDMINNFNQYYSTDEDLFMIEYNWWKFYNNLNSSSEIIVNQFLKTDNWKKLFLVYYLGNLLTNKADINLPTNDNNLIQLEEKLKDINKEQIKFIRQFWFSKQIDATSRFEEKHSNLSVENLYIKRSGSKHKRMSLRQIVQFDADLFTTFFPIILTTPDVCSNLFKGMNDYFDIVMFDEASQLKIEDNLPALLKGKQIVIAGDEHQMPPSNYFSKIFDGDYEDDDDIEEDIPKIDKDNSILSCESLLEFANELNFEKKYLDFHYRSKHPYLIDFSNYAFYKQRLKPLPNNFEYKPISYIQVNGTFSDHTNEVEADMVLSILEHNINRLPSGEYPTVGIATFNISQRNLIKNKLIERQKFSKYKDFNEKVNELEENGLFVKNLENIQGDERDIIIISTTYGISKDGRFSNRFGPINQTKGNKLLNVIITRAKYKVFLCTSIPEAKFLNYKEDLIIEGQNNRKAVFFAYLAYCKFVSDGNNEGRISVLSALSENSEQSVSFESLPGELESPFEEEVYQELFNVYGSDKIIPQFKFAGFRIDLVFDHKIPNVPKIAIECDGAKYHSSEEAYLYDRHRQKILESHGFVFHRIWSTNWWRNPNREIKKMLNFIEEVKNITITKPSDSNEYSKTFEEKSLNLDTLLSEKSSESIKSDKDFIQTLEFPDDENTIVEEKIKVQLNSKIAVRYLNNNKELKIHIVETENPSKSNTDIYQKLYYKSPLCVSVMGSSVGDIVKIGNLDNYVEITEIL